MDHNKEKLSRRVLIQRILASIVGVGVLEGCSQLQPQPGGKVDRWVKSVCRFCGTGCGIQVGVQGGKVVEVMGDVDAHNKGRLCIKGILTREILYAPNRLLHPLIREGGHFRRASWEEALDLAARRFKEAIQRYGPDSVAFYGSGQLFSQESYIANKLFKAGIRTNNVDGNPRLCMASAAVGYTSVFGKDEPIGCYEDFDHATLFLVWGSNMAECHPVLFERMMDRKRSYPETQVIVVDPRRTRTAKSADRHLMIRPGTDVVLLNTLLHEVIAQGFVDQEMVRDYLTFQEGEETRTFEDFIAFLQDFTPERSAPVCGIGPHEIREVAALFGNAQSAMSLWTMGVNQQIHGSAINRLLCALHLLTGQIGREGATPFSLTGQPNAGGGVRDTGSLSHALPYGRLVENPEHRAEMERLWGVPPGTISPRRGYSAVELFQAMEAGKVKCCLIMATNPAQSLPDAERYRKAMEKCFLVVAEAFHPTETSRLADVVLPSAMWVEKEGVFSQSERRYHLVPKCVEPPGEARSDLEILVAFAEKMGLGHLITARTPEAVWEEMQRISKGTPYDFSGMTYERLKRERGLLWPCPTPEHRGTCRRYIPGQDPLAKGPGRFDFYGRKDKRAVIWIERPRPFADPADEEFPLTLTTGRILEHWHTTTITGGLKELRDIPIDFLEIHPYDAHPRGIREGDWVEVRSRRGSVRLRARLTEDIRVGVVFATFHSAKHLVNRVTNDAYDPISRQPEFKLCAVQVKKVEEEG